jgi:hypothetical protein
MRAGEAQTGMSDAPHGLGGQALIEREAMRSLTFLVLAITLTSCESNSAKLQEDERQFHAVAQAQVDAQQWKLDDATATRLFDDGTQAGIDRYMTFRKCHEEPPTKDANKKACAALQRLVAKAEVSEQTKIAKEKANW